MKKNGFLLLNLTVCIVVLLCAGNQSAYALGDSGTIRSSGNIVFEGQNGTINLVGSDLSFLQEKLSTIPTSVYDPEYYTHLHDWDYESINESAHSKKCGVCGEITSNYHASRRQEQCSFTYNGKTYAGYTYTCECGHQWTREVSHNPVYSLRDDDSHIVKCELEDTGYCSGPMEQVENHSINLQPNDDGEHHYLKCHLCNYEREEACDFTTSVESDDDMSILWYCECGNCISGNKETDNPAEPEQGLSDEKTDD